MGCCFVDDEDGDVKICVDAINNRKESSGTGKMQTKMEQKC